MGDTQAWKKHTGELRKPQSPNEVFLHIANRMENLEFMSNVK
jgi:hypothetical protein